MISLSAIFFEVHSFSVQNRTNISQRKETVYFARFNTQVKIKVQEDVFPSSFSFKNAMFLID